MRKNLNPVVTVVVIIVAIIGLGLMGMAVMNHATHEDKVVVQPADPNQMKPDPKLNVQNSGT